MAFTTKVSDYTREYISGYGYDRDPRTRMREYELECRVRELQDAISKSVSDGIKDVQTKQPVQSNKKLLLLKDAQ